MVMLTEMVTSNVTLGVKLSVPVKDLAGEKESEGVGVGESDKVRNKEARLTVIDGVGSSVALGFVRLCVRASVEEIVDVMLRVKVSSGDVMKKYSSVTSVLDIVSSGVGDAERL